MFTHNVYPPSVSKRLPKVSPRPLPSLPTSHMTLLYYGEGCVGCVVSPGLSECATACPVASTAWGGSAQAPTPIQTTPSDKLGWGVGNNCTQCFHSSQLPSLRSFTTIINDQLLLNNDSTQITVNSIKMNNLNRKLPKLQIRIDPQIITLSSTAHT